MSFPVIDVEGEVHLIEAKVPGAQPGEEVLVAEGGDEFVANAGGDALLVEPNDGVEMAEEAEDWMEAANAVEVEKEDGSVVVVSPVYKDDAADAAPAPEAKAASTKTASDKEAASK